MNKHSCSIDRVNYRHLFIVYSPNFCSKLQIKIIISNYKLFGVVFKFFLFHQPNLAHNGKPLMAIGIHQLSQNTNRQYLDLQQAKTLFCTS